jgi:hypothetical protein
VYFLLMYTVRCLRYKDGDPNNNNMNHSGTLMYQLLDTEARGKILCFCWGSNPDHLVSSQTLGSNRY